MSGQPMTMAGYKVDLQQMEDAITTIRQQAETIALRTSTIGTTLQGVPSFWNSPAEVPFGELAQACTTQMTTLTNLLEEMITRMTAAYQNYLDAEQSNVATFQSPSAGNKPASQHRTNH